MDQQGSKVYRTEKAHSAYKGKSVWGKGLYLGLDKNQVADMTVDPNSSIVEEPDYASVKEYSLPKNIKLKTINADKKIPNLTGEELRTSLLRQGFDGAKILTGGDLNLGGDQVVVYNQNMIHNILNPNQLQSTSQQGEQGIPQDELQEIVPDLVTNKGKAMVQGLLEDAARVKPELDNQLRLVTWKAGLDPKADFESRLKNPDTVVRKVATHRKNGKDGYRANDVNDLYGARIIADTPEQKKNVISQLHDLNENNWTKIDKEEQVDHGTYHAYHMDLNKKGVKAEVQIHDPHSLFEAVANHDIRSKFGEHPPAPLDTVKQRVSQLGYKMPADQAQKTAQTIQAMRILQGR